MGKKIYTTNLVSLIATLLSLLVTVSYGTWFISTIEKRVSLLEKNMTEFSEEISLFRDQVNLANVAQDRAQRRFEDQINEKITNVENKMDNVHLELKICLVFLKEIIIISSLMRGG